MQPKKPAVSLPIFRADLNQSLDKNHPLCLLAHDIDWSAFEAAFTGCYTPNWGRPGKPIRLLVGLHYLKSAYNESDESVIERWIESPYWQYFCGFTLFQHTCPIDPSNLSRWRMRVGPEKLEALLAQTIETAKAKKLVKPAQTEKVVVDTTVQEKATAYPTDARLFHKARATLVREAKKRGIALRQSFERLSRKALLRQNRLRHAGHKRKAAGQVRKLKSYLRHVLLDIARKADADDAAMKELLYRAAGLLTQTRESKDKLFSFHAPEVECIGKGKVHKKYEFGVKVGLAITAKGNWIVGAQSFPGKPYDGHTLAASLAQVERITKNRPVEALVDRGYRGHDAPADVNVLIDNKAKNRTRRMRKWMGRRSAVEPIIGHAKQDHRMGRNHLKGKIGDATNAILAAAGFNFRKLIRAYARIFLRLLFEWLSAFPSAIQNGVAQAFVV